MTIKTDAVGLKQILQNAFFPATPAVAPFQSTCVFLLIFGGNDPCILAVQKSDTEGYPWRNQVALPGGHVDQKDSSPLDAAFRELEEELNIPRDHVEFIGSIGHFQTIHQKDIEVFIGWWNGQSLIRHDSEEIARVLKIPLSELVGIHKARNYHGRLPEGLDLLYPVKDVIIWGVTAKILHRFIELLFPLLSETGEGKLRIDGGS